MKTSKNCRRVIVGSIAIVLTGGSFVIAETTTAHGAQTGAMVSISSSSIPAAPPLATLADAPATYTTLPALPSPLTDADAVEAAKDMAVKAPSTSSSVDAQPDSTSSVAGAASDVSDMSYAQFESWTTMGRSAQLPLSDPVVVVTIDAPFSTAWLPSPPTAQPTIWPTYSVAFDPRSGYPLWIGPKPLSS